MNAKSPTDPIVTQISNWGITAEEITPAILEYAENIIAVPSSRIGDIVVQFNLATREEIERHVRNKPVNVFMLEHLCNHIDNLRPHSQKMLAANDRLAYYDSLSNAPIHPDFQTNAALRAFCQELYCLPLCCTEKTSLRLVFTDYTVQKNYAQRARITRITDPIGQFLQKNEISTLIFGIAQREQISNKLHSNITEDVTATDDEDQITFWSEANASTPAQKILARILSIAVEKSASNVKFTPNHNGTVDIFYRRHGNLRSIPGIRTISAQQAAEINRFLHVKSIARHTDTAKRVEGRLLSPADGQFVYHTATTETFLRCSYIPAANDGLSFTMESVSMRLLPRNAVNIKMEDINISPTTTTVLHNYLLQTHGLILIVGPTSSGKSTTIAGIISQYIEIFDNSRNLLSLEQPVERHLNGITQINVHQSKFESSMAALLRHDPDFIWVGELRDRPSASTCIRAANTGHIVVSTLHADDTPTAYNALLSYINNNTGSSADSVIVTQYDAISALSLIIAQRLIPTLCPHCKQPLSEDEKNYADRLYDYDQYCQRNGYQREKINNTYIRNLEGCDRCDHEGYIGETPINEILPITRDLRAKLIKMANARENDLDILAQQRTNTLYREAMHLVQAGKVAINDALI